MQNKNLIIFDMDGVIVDVSNSYRDVVRQTTTEFFKPAKAAKQLPEPLFELSDLAAVKQSGGLNNDWDLTAAVINMLYSLTDKPTIHQSENPWIKYRETICRCDVTVMAEYLNTDAQPLASLLKDKGKPQNDFIAELYAGDIGSGNIIKQIFQEIYLGPALFRSTYDKEPEIYHREGYVLREKLLLERSILQELSQENLLAIATGRPRSEAEYPLKHYKIRQFFRMILTLDDCIREEKRIFAEAGKSVSLSKPDPFMLDAIAAGHRNAVNGFFYIGDMPDDMLAAARSRFDFKSIGILISAPDKSGLREELLRAGADFIVKDFESLKKILL